ncbi:hypothetical protein PSP6_210063 [Paraburkholderia tropica]|nr:hypothetical protein PSP6_210063 [Paraburkholderia tropica]
MFQPLREDHPRKPDSERVEVLGCFLIKRPRWFGAGLSSYFFGSVMPHGFSHPSGPHDGTNSTSI